VTGVKIAIHPSLNKNPPTKNNGDNKELSPRETNNLYEFNIIAGRTIHSSQ
jgi:hypothetical protein